MAVDYDRYTDADIPGLKVEILKMASDARVEDRFEKAGEVVGRINRNVLIAGKKLNVGQFNAYVQNLATLLKVDIPVTANPLPGDLASLVALAKAHDKAKWDFQKRHSALYQTVDLFEGAGPRDIAAATVFQDIRDQFVDHANAIRVTRLPGPANELT